MKFSIAMIAGLFLVASASYAVMTVNGTTITFSDNSMQSTAQVEGPQGPQGPTGPEGPAGAQGIQGDTGLAGSDANVPPGHGGTGNSVSGTDSFIGGGINNIASEDRVTVGGGGYNTASGNSSTVGGGAANTASGNSSTVGGGRVNMASGLQSTVSGGDINTAIGGWSTVGGGRTNLVTDDYGTIGGGQGNQAGDDAGTTSDRKWATVGGGVNNMASGNWSTVGGGSGNTASGNYSFVAGTGANDSGNNNSFVWGGAAGARTSFAADTFNVWSAEIYLNGSVAHGSDRDMKEAFSFVSAREVLDKVVEMPVTTWRFKSEDDTVRHIGPMAQDFMAAFGYGRSDTHIVGTDADGVALAAIQGLYAMQRKELQEQAEVNTALRWHNAQLEARLTRLENAILRK